MRTSKIQHVVVNFLETFRLNS